MSGQSKGQIVGYARVSTGDQNLDRQIVALGRVDQLFTEVMSGKSASRPQLQEMMTYLRKGDTLKVSSPDRLARSTRDLLSIVEQLKGKGVEVEFVDNPALNTNTPQGEFMLTVLAAVAQLERSVIRERQREGIAIARKKGKYVRGPRLNHEQVEVARQKIREGVPKTRIAKDLHVSRQTLYAALAETGPYAANGAKQAISVKQELVTKRA